MNDIGFKMRLFVWSVALSLILLLCFAEAVTILLPPPPRPGHVLPVHKTLYLERTISDEQLFHLLEAAIEWNTVTDGQVVFNIKRLPRPTIDQKDSLVVFNVTPDYPDIIILDNARKKPLSTLAYFSGERMLPYIAIVDTRISEKDYTGVMLHELGHYLGLQHPDTEDAPEIGMGSLMYSNIDSGSQHVTTEDLQQFCELYHCDWKKFHGLPEIQ